MEDIIWQISCIVSNNKCLISSINVGNNICIILCGRYHALSAIIYALYHVRSIMHCPIYACIMYHMSLLHCQQYMNDVMLLHCQQYMNDVMLSHCQQNMNDVMLLHCQQYMNDVMLLHCQQYMNYALRQVSCIFNNAE